MNTSRMCRSICSSLSAAGAAWVISTTAEDDYRYAAEARCMLMLILSTCALALLRTEHRQPETAFWAILWSWSILWNMYSTPSRWFRPAVLLWLMVTCASACSNARLARVHAGLRSWLAYMVTLPCAPAVLALTMTWKSEAAQALARSFPMFGFQSADQGNHIGSGRSPARPAQSTARSRSRRAPSPAAQMVVEEQCCRLCLGDEGDGPLVQPCVCRGSAMWIHKACLEYWRRTSPREDAAYRCGQCMDEYRDALSLELLSARLQVKRTGGEDTLSTLDSLAHELQAQGMQVQRG